MNLIEEIARSSTEASLYEMLAEEAAELSSAASKYARFLRKEQPVKEGLTKEILLEHVIEEYADVDVSMTAAAAKTEDGVIDWRLKNEHCNFGYYIFACSRLCLLARILGWISVWDDALFC